MFTTLEQVSLLRGDNMSVFFTRRGPAPVLGKMLSDYAEGDIVLLNENGSPVEFYVAKHDYESGLNGAGRTLVVRKDCYGNSVWNSSNTNTYADSTIDTWLNGTYRTVLDTDVQEAIGATKFYYTPGAGVVAVTVLERAIFILSYTELNGTGAVANNEGAALGIASFLQIAYLNGSAIDQWTRSVNLMASAYAFYLDSNNPGYVNGAYCTYSKGARPCFTLPSTAIFNPDTNQLLKV